MEGEQKKKANLYTCSESREGIITESWRGLFFSRGGGLSPVFFGKRRRESKGQRIDSPFPSRKE